MAGRRRTARGTAAFARRAVDEAGLDCRAVINEFEELDFNSFV
ncbi:hypothetical protein SY94_5606 (plasmid) [Agrobacterium tumefaciens]|jgi:hypothetical protein|nr:hypothetical protein SY94_5606 [Agrobacterium tumefaciens]